MNPVTLTSGSRNAARRILSFAFLGKCLVSFRARRRYRYLAVAVVVCVGAAYWYSPANKLRAGVAPNTGVPSETEIDEALQQAATESLGDREGAIIIMDPQTGRVRALVNSQVAFERAYPIGSTIKPFTALAAMRAGLIDKDSRTRCRGEYAGPGFALACTHPKDLPAFDTSAALAYSCNYYFGSLGERLSEERLSDTLTSFGFGKRTGISAENEALGQLLRGRREARNALGEGEYLQATPIQLVTAYAALVNGGHLFTPRSASAKDFHAQLHDELLITPEQRAAIAAGMRGAVVFGTAAPAGLGALPLSIFGKTGTSTQLKGFRTHGWFVGFALTAETSVEPPPERVELAVLVFLYKGHGAQAAEVARPIFATYERAKAGDGEVGRRGDGAEESKASLQSNHPITPSPRLPLSSGVRVHLVTENTTREMPLEDYVLGVVAAEGSTEDQPGALKALAIAARTFALKNLGRHAGDGYDFCTLTHCQRFIDQTNVRTRAAVVAAVRETNDMVLHDQDGQIVDSYFSASCGGATANMQTLWGGKAPGYLRGVPDEYCSSMPHHSWTDNITASQLLQALHSDARTDPGTRLADVVITRRDATGRAESIAIEGERRRTVSGWDFKIIVGRALGWNLLKSSRFDISRSGSNFIFRGSGFGHGLGLCQEGAHVMAQRGAGYVQILAKYFPGTSVAEKNEVETRRHGEEGTRRHGQARTRRHGDTATRGRAWHADILPSPRLRIPVSPPLRVSVSPRPRVSASPRPRLSLSSEHFRVSYPTRVEQRDAEHILATLESTRADLLRRIAAAGIVVNQFPALELFINDTTGDFVGRTGQPWWAAAATRGKRIELQPIEVLNRRGALDTTLRHELVHPLIDQLSHGRAPRWLAEGMALYLAGEGPTISRFTPRVAMTTDEIDKKLASGVSSAEMRAAYASAYQEVKTLIMKHSEAEVWLRVVRSAKQ